MFRLLLVTLGWTGKVLRKRNPIPFALLKTTLIVLSRENGGLVLVGIRIFHLLQSLVLAPVEFLLKRVTPLMALVGWLEKLFTRVLLLVALMTLFW